MKLRGREKGKRRGGAVAVTAVVAAVLVVLSVAAWVFGGEISPTGARRAFLAIIGRDEREFALPGGYDEAFAPLESGFVSAGSMGIATHDSFGNEKTRELISLRAPAARADGSVALVYSVGGKQLFCVEKSGVTARLETSGEIVSASIGGGVIAVAQLQSGDHRGVIRCYRRSGGELALIYEWYSGGYYTLAADVSDDGKNLAVLEMGADGGRIVLLRLDSTEPIGEVRTDGEMVLELDYIRDGTLIYRTRAAVYALGRDMSRREIYALGGDTLRAFTSDGADCIILYVESGNDCALVRVTPRGQSERIPLPYAQFVSLRASNGGIVLLRLDGARLFGSNLRELDMYGDAEVYADAWCAGGNRVIAAGPRGGRRYGI
ncbi:MAG: DUF5711 family protein [Oscillospiraceae bacterium]|jgi:hypothetical protein|nr:DUF5711 family protein [Oscillospiraceae bacterium]